MQFPGRIALLSSTIANLSSCIDMLDPEERMALADMYWEASVREHIAARDYEGAFYRIKCALLGEKAFDGVDRICKAHVEGEPTDLIASTITGMGMIHVLYYAMCHAHVFDGIPTPLLSSNDDSDSPFSGGGRVAEMMYHCHEARFTMAAHQISMIAVWVNNHRRIKSQAA